MKTSKAEDTLQMLPLKFIKAVHEVRPVNPTYVSKLREKIKQIGLKPYPLSVTPDGVLFGGIHRYEAFKKEGIAQCFMHVSQPSSLDREAIELNRASEDSLPMSFVDYAELVWRKSEDQTQEAIGKELGWSRQGVSNYVALQKIGCDVWKLIATTVREVPLPRPNGDVADDATTVAITENLLRLILALTAAQQMELIKLLIRGKDRKGHRFGKTEFKQLAEWYEKMNALIVVALDALAQGIVDDEARKPYEKKLLDEIAQDIYVQEFSKGKIGPETAKLIQALIDEYTQTTNSRVIVKDMRDLSSSDIADGSVDAIITDPPYAREFIDLFAALGELASRVLKPGGSLVVLCGHSYLPQYFELLSRTLDYLWTIGIHLPGGQAVQLYQREVTTFWKPALWFTQGARNGKWVSDFIRTDVNNNDKTHHEWGQSEQMMSQLTERLTLTGDLVLDPFLGGGTTGVVCRKMNRKFIGVEIDKKVAAKAAARIRGEVEHGERS